jgi:hypothetical protein
VTTALAPAAPDTRRVLTPADLADHVDRMAERHPPIPLQRVDTTTRDPATVRAVAGRTLAYLARVELEVERNVLELLTLLPDAGGTDRRFQRVWARQEIHHGLALDRLQQDLGLPAAAPELRLNTGTRVLGALAHLRPVQDVVRFLYFLTGAATEKSAVIAYSTLHRRLLDLGERAVAETVVAPIRRQEPSHLAFYRLSATAMLQRGELAPWQLHLARVLRRRSFAPVGARTPATRAHYGDVLVELGFADDLEHHAAQLAVVDRELLWAAGAGMRVPPYVLEALADALRRAGAAAAQPGAGPDRPDRKARSSRTTNAWSSTSGRPDTAIAPTTPVPRTVIGNAPPSAA